MSEQFENSIRKKLQDAEIPFDPDAWEKMKKRLDDSGRRRPALFWWMLSGLLIFVAAGSFWWWSQQSQQPLAEQRIPVTDSTSSAITKKEQAPSAGSPLFVGSPSAPVHAEHAGKEATNVDKQEVSTTGASSKRGQQVSVPVSGNPTSSGSTQQGSTSSVLTNTASSETTPISVTTNTVSSKSTSTSTHTKTSETTQQVLTPASAGTTSSGSRPSTVITTGQESTSGTTQQPTSPDTSKTSSPPPAEKKKTRKGFEGGITIGPDINIASSMKMGRIGLSAGVLLRYHFNNRWGIQTGAVFSKKIYGATPKDYHFDYPTTYTKIDADCNVVDVPLNVSYTFLERPRSNWSIIAGASSYFMLNEQYDYYYENGTKRSREYKNQNQHYFSVLNLGVNWEKQTMGRLRWALQPYVKVPLGGVGQGKVKLYSAGVALQLTMGKK